MSKNNVMIAEGDTINGQQLIVVKSAGKLGKLNELQLAKAEEVKNFWLNYLFSCKNNIDRPKANNSIEWLYKLVGVEKPIIVYLDSPMACQIATNILKQAFKNGALSGQVSGQVRDQVSDQVRDQVRDQKLEWYDFAAYGGATDYGWVSFYDFFTQIGVINHKGFNEFKELLLSGIYDMIQLNGFCIVSELPIHISRNNNGQLLNLDGPAIEFKDGYVQHFINGVYVSPELFDSLLNKRYSLENFIAEKNEETKAACLFFMREKWGEDFLISFFADHLKEVDTYVDKKKEDYLVGTNGGMNIGVYTLFKGNLNGINIAYVRCYCPSTDRMFYLGVDPTQSNAKDAIASLYRIPSCLKNHIKEIRRQGERFSTTLTDAGNDILKRISKSDAENLITITGAEYFSKMTYEY